MSSNNKRVVVGSGGIGFAGLLAIAFIVLKLTGNIDWGWGWVLSPLWISSCCIFPTVFLLIVIVGAIWAVVDR